MNLELRVRRLTLLLASLTFHSTAWGQQQTEDPATLAREVFQKSMASQGVRQGTVATGVNPAATTSTNPNVGATVGFGGTYVAPAPTPTAVTTPAVSPPSWNSGTGAASTTTPSTSTTSTTTLPSASNGSASGTSSTGSGNATQDGSGSASTSTPSTDSGMNSAANRGQQSQMIGAAINGAVGAGLTAACFANDPPQWMLCAMGAMAFMQAGQDLASAGQSGQTGASTYGGNYSTPNYNPTGGGNGGGGSGGTNNPGGGTSPGPTPSPTTPGAVGFNNNPLAQTGFQGLKEAGYQVSPAGVTTPDGTFIPASSFGSASGMAAAGIGGDTIKDIQKVMAALNDESSKVNGSKVSSLALDGSGGGGAGGGADGGRGGSAGLALAPPQFKNPFAVNALDQRQLVAGKTVTFGGEPIGVRGQDIFEMVHQAYEKKRQRNNFIESESPAPVQLRAPASVSPAAAAKPTVRIKPR